MNCEYVLLMEYSLQREFVRFYSPDPEMAIEEAHRRIKRKREDLKGRFPTGLVPVIKAQLFQSCWEFDGMEFMLSEFSVHSKIQ